MRKSHSHAIALYLEAREIATESVGRIVRWWSDNARQRRVCTLKMLRRSSSFKRAVRSRSAAEVNSVTVEKSASKDASGSGSKDGSGGISIKGAVSIRAGKKWQSAFAVLYSRGATGTVAIHKGAKDYTPFRAFPDELIFLPKGEVRVVPEPTADSAVAAALRVEVGSQPPLLLAFDSCEVMERWASALRPMDVRAAAEDAAIAAAAARAAEEAREKAERVAEAAAQVRAMKADIARQRDALASMRADVAFTQKRSAQVRAEHKELAEYMVHELPAAWPASAAGGAAASREDETPALS